MPPPPVPNTKNKIKVPNEVECLEIVKENQQAKYDMLIQIQNIDNQIKSLQQRIKQLEKQKTIVKIKCEKKQLSNFKKRFYEKLTNSFHFHFHLPKGSPKYLSNSNSEEES